MEADAMRIARNIVAGHLENQPEHVLIMARGLCEIRPILIEADSELSAIAHGRLPSDNETLKDLAYRLRGAYEKQKGGA